MGRLAGYEGYVTGEHFPPDHPFWEKPLQYWDVNPDGVRWAYIASVFSARLMVGQRSGFSFSRV